MITWRSTKTNGEAKARDIISTAVWLHTTFKNEIWLWRGQANEEFGITPGMHTRVIDAKYAVPSDVDEATTHLLDVARKAGVDVKDGNHLPDLPLLASLQHYGAATPLLDVSVDPLVALWMLANASPEDPAGSDGIAGRLFGIRKPPKERWIKPMDSRPFAGGGHGTLTSQMTASAGYYWYEAPDVTERLRIQRGSFLISPMRSDGLYDDTSTLIQTSADGQTDTDNFISRRIEKRGKSSNTTRSPETQAFSILVPGAAKPFLRTLLAERSGLTLSAIYPTPWHQPFIEQLSKAYARNRPLGLDIPVRAAKPGELQQEADEAREKAEAERVRIAAADARKARDKADRDSYKAWKKAQATDSKVKKAADPSVEM